MNIVYAMTRNVYRKILPSIKSLHEYHPDAKVYILAEDDKLPFKLPMKCKIINISDQTIFTEKTCVNIPNRFGNAINLLKVCYPTFLSDIDKVIHLDLDTIVCDSLDDFWNIDVTDKWFASVPEYLAKHGREHLFGDVYYNMGVSLINLKQMREDGIEEVMVKYLNEIAQPFADQDAWNKYGIEQDKAVAVPLRFNENQSTGYTDNPAIVHYCGISDWYENPNIERRQYIDKYLDTTQKYMIHVCNKREDYVAKYLVPSMIEQGIPEDDIILWHDKDCIGNLASFVASCRWVGENLEPFNSTWHLQDDVVISKRFREVAEKGYPGFANAFCNEKFDGERTNYIGGTSVNGMWFSFQCILIPNRLAGDFAKWFDEECIPNNLYPEWVASGRCDDSIFRAWAMSHVNLMATNIYPNIVDHVDYLIGGTACGTRKVDDVRKSYWRDDALNEAVRELEEKMAYDDPS